MRAISMSVLLLVVCAFQPQAAADIFGYTDANGVTHLSNVPTDNHYALVLKAPPEPVVRNPSSLTGPAGNWQARAASYSNLINHAAQKTAVQPELLRAIIAVESAFNPHAVSRAGAQGLMQLHPKTARRYGVGNAFDPEQNVHGGARYLRDLLHRYDNDLELALAAYNAGEEAVDRYGRQIPPFRETREYVPAVIRLYRQFLTQAT
jgi:soluble lytic murein transglycosylase-like protein